MANSNRPQSVTAAARLPPRRLAATVQIAAWLGAAWSLVAAPAAATAQPARYELGRRVRAMEETWETQRDPSIRRAALPPIQRAVENFFALRLPAAARELDEARLVLEGHIPRSDTPATAEQQRDLAARRWSAALSFEPTRRLLDPRAETHLDVELRHFYPVPQPSAEQIRVVLTLRAADGQTLATAALDARADAPAPMNATETNSDVKSATPPAAKSKPPVDARTEWRRVARVPLNASMADQDCRLEAAAVVDRDSYPLGSTAIALATELAERLAVLRESPPRPRSENQLTLQEHLRVLEALAGGRTLETDYPAHRLLVEATRSHALKADLAVEDATGTPKADSTPKATGALKAADGTRLAAGQHWRAIVGAADSSCLLRLLIPTGSAEKAAEKADVKAAEKGSEQAAERRSLVVAVHGAGGSENMFFDAYGAGKIARLCESRGWLLAAPRQGLWGGVGIQWDELVAGVDRLAPVDPARVYLVGHSLGAMQAARLADTAERKPAFVAALGGGGRVNRFERLLDVPFFVGVGDKDFGRGGGKQLADLLRRGGIRDVRFREYPDTEHLTIVQVALEDIFQQLDERDAALRRVSTSR
jgi:predicted esterase